MFVSSKSCALILPVFPLTEPPAVPLRLSNVRGMAVACFDLGFRTSLGSSKLLGI